MQFAGMGLMATYAIVFLGMFIEGELFLVLAGILVRGQVINYTDTIMVAFCAVMLHDIGYWIIGSKMRGIKRKKFWIVDVDRMERFFKKLKKREGLYIFLSKFAWGMNRFTLISSGYFKTSFKKLLTYSIPAAFIWTITFISLGYMLADRAELWKKDIKTMAMVAAVFFIGLLCIEYLIGRSIKEDAQLPNEGRQNVL